MSVEDSVTSLVDFDLSQSKFSVAGMIQERDPSPMDKRPASISKQGSNDSKELPLSGNRQPSTNMNNSSILNRSNGGPGDDLAMSMEEDDFAISESNFSHSMMSNKVVQFTGVASGNSSST